MTGYFNRWWKGTTRPGLRYAAAWWVTPEEYSGELIIINSPRIPVWSWVYATAVVFAMFHGELDLRPDLRKKHSKRAPDNYSQRQMHSECPAPATPGLDVIMWNAAIYINYSPICTFETRWGAVILRNEKALTEFVYHSPSQTNSICSNWLLKSRNQSTKRGECNHYIQWWGSMQRKLSQAGHAFYWQRTKVHIRFK